LERKKKVRDDWKKKKKLIESDWEREEEYRKESNEMTSVGSSCSEQEIDCEED